MNQTATTGRRESSITLSELRHDIRNHLNTIKLSAALLQRRGMLNEFGQQSLHEIGQAVEDINQLLTRFLGDADAPSLLKRDPGQ